MTEAGKFHELKVLRVTSVGVYLQGEGEDILLPKRFVPPGTKPGDMVRVFIYHDSDNRKIATTQQPLGVVGDIVGLPVVSVSRMGAFLDWGLMKDLLLPLSQQKQPVRQGQTVVVQIYLDAQTGRVAATEKFNHLLSNDDLTVKENQEVDLTIYRKTDLGYEVIINQKHLGLLHFADVFQDLEIGSRLKGFIKKIRSDKKIDVMAGQRGYEKVEGETEKILRMLRSDPKGYLPYDDQSDPEEIRQVFSMSKKTFKMALGALYKQKKIRFGKTGILLEEKK